MHHVKWPSIESFHNVRKAIAKYPHICKDRFKVTYRGKIKLHGTNACVQIVAHDNGAPPEMDVLAQSRTAILDINHDNAGFAAWVQKTEKNWKAVIWHFVRKVANNFVPGSRVQSVCFFGEWCGKGIQKGTAINNIEGKILAIFGVMIVTDKQELPIFISDPATILMFLPTVPDTYVLPFLDEGITIDFSKSADELQETVALINERVDAVEKCDPWVKETFGAEGIGEGIVYYPVSSVHAGRESFSNLSFKAKGEKHKVVRQKKAVQVDPETAASISDFAELVLTDARLEQGVTEGCGGEYDTKKIGPFIGWVTKDVNKECQSELEASGLTWKQVSKVVSARARTWYMQKIETT
jgi:hypothetical protein